MSTNRNAELIPIADMIAEIEKTFQLSTPAVAWYPDQEEVRGPFCRWLTISEVSPEYKKHVADRPDEARYIASALNYAPTLAKYIKNIQVAGLTPERIAARCNLFDELLTKLKKINAFDNSQLEQDLELFNLLKKCDGL